ncbi:MAG: DMT family transporter [Bacteroidales bacterium]|nr:DMT family transporter [Bacteroides sp.]MCM1199162.1 DMT family transporter [Clostridium sp.]MCM1501417.1 DMT family transporter [Bacteroidales bacterium]
MWLLLAFTSAALLGLYDTSKKAALKDNAVLPVLFLNTLFSTLIFLPAIIGTAGEWNWHSHLLVIVKSAIVLVSWIFGYFGLKHLPITIVGPINATRPILVLIGAMLFFGERLNAYQWTGVVLAVFSLFLLSRSSKKENVDFTHNKWIFCVAVAAVVGACSGLYDKYIMQQLSPTFVQGWYNFYQMLMMGTTVSILWLPNRKSTTPFHWSWAIPLISIFISAADFAYLSAMHQPDSMISIVSLVRRSSVIISFICGALIFKERNLKAKAIDLLFILAGMFFIWLGSR